MAKVIVSQNLKGCKVSGTNVTEAGTIRTWEGSMSGKIQFASGNRKCFWVSGPKGGWLNIHTFSGTIGSYTYKNLPATAQKSLEPTATINGHQYKMVDRKWVPVTPTVTTPPKPATQAVTIGSQPTILVINNGDTHSLTQLQSWIQAQLQAVKA